MRGNHLPSTIHHRLIKIQNQDHLLTIDPPSQILGDLEQLGLGIFGLGFRLEGECANVLVLPPITQSYHTVRKSKHGMRANHRSWGMAFILALVL